MADITVTQDWTPRSTDGRPLLRQLHARLRLARQHRRLASVDIDQPGTPGSVHVDRWLSLYLRNRL